MKQYSYEFRMANDEVFYSPLMSKTQAMAKARHRSRAFGEVVYVLDENRNGHVAYVGGRIDHKEGADV